jgi:5-methyltetrahydrofolate corrinoid/iron sulfur protein methyltransferase
MIFVADNINPMNPVAAQAVASDCGDEVRALAGQCAAAGAVWIDVNPGYLSERRRGRMETLVHAVCAGAPDVRLVLDSPVPEVLERGLRACAGTSAAAPVLSALTMEPAKLQGILPLAVDNAGTDLVCLLLDERSLCPVSAEEKMALALALRSEAQAAGVDPARLIFDPVLPNLSWPDAKAHLDAAVQCVQTIASGDLFGEPARTMAGISNLLSGGLRRTHAALLEYDAARRLAAAGLYAALCNVLNDELLENFQ